MEIDEQITKSSPGANGVSDQVQRLVSFLLSGDESMEKDDEIKELRKILWLHHGCSGPRYGDDGEMQCNCGYHYPIDFKRDTVDDILRKLRN